MNSDLKIWCILIPTLKANNSKKPFFSTRHHKVWDSYVRKLAGGLTIFAPSKGKWTNENNQVVEEKVLPVNIACTKEVFDKIISFTMNHYDQDALMYYKVSDEVFIVKRGENG